MLRRIEAINVHRITTGKFYNMDTSFRVRDRGSPVSDLSLRFSHGFLEKPAFLRSGHFIAVGIYLGNRH